MQSLTFRAILVVAVGACTHEAGAFNLPFNPGFCRSHVVRPQFGQSEELAEAAMYGDFVRVEQLLKEGYSANSWMEPGFPALCNAAHTNNVDMVRLLVASGANVNQATFTKAVPAWVACESNAVECLQIIAENKGDLDSPSRDGQTPGMAAAIKGHLECIKLLSQYGANLDHRPSEGDFQGKSAQDLAAENGHAAIVEFLSSR